MSTLRLLGILSAVSFVAGISFSVVVDVETIGVGLILSAFGAFVSFICACFLRLIRFPAAIIAPLGLFASIGSIAAVLFTATELRRSLPNLGEAQIGYFLFFSSAFSTCASMAAIVALRLTNARSWFDNSVRESKRAYSINTSQTGTKISDSSNPYEPPK